MASASAGQPPTPVAQHQIIDKVNAKTYSVVTGQIPETLKDALRVDFSPEELEAIYAQVNKTLAPPSKKPQALWIFGPSAVGKSSLGHAKSTDLFGCAQNAVTIDGGEFRCLHAGWQAVAVHGHEHGVLHADAWKIFQDSGKRASNATSGWSGQLKRRLLAEALRDRQHVIIPDCANHPDRLQAMIEQVRAAGYGMHALCLWAPVGQTRSRGEERAVSEGKVWSAKDYEKSTRGSLALAMRWIDGIRDQPESYCSLELWDNTHFPAAEVGLEQYAKLVAMSEAEAHHHAEHRAEQHRQDHHRASAMNANAAAKLRKNSAAFVAGLTALSTPTNPGAEGVTAAGGITSSKPDPVLSISKGVVLHAEVMTPSGGHQGVGSSSGRQRAQARMEGALVGSAVGVAVGVGFTAMAWAMSA